MSDYEPPYNKECEVVRDEANDFPQDSPLNNPGVEPMLFEHVALFPCKSELCLPEGKLKRIHINQHVIRGNAKREAADWKPPITVKTSDANHKGWSVDMHGVGSIMYRPDKPLNCGAKVWIETRGPVTISLNPE